jgi:hypothetical protein
MSDYSKSTNFTTKDTLPTGNSGKIVKGTELDTEFTAVSSAIASKADISSPNLLGTPTAPTATTGSNTTQLANTAYVKQEITALGTLGTMSTQNKTAVDITGGTITGGTITGITDLAVADGGTGRSTLTANAVLIGNGTSGITSISPGTSGNVLKSDGTNWTSAANASPTVLYDQAISADTTYSSVSLTASNRPVQISINMGAIQGGATTISITFEWGIGSLTNSYQPVNSNVNYVVYPCPSLTTFVTPTTSSTLYFRISTSNLTVTGARVSVIQL